MRIAHLTDIHWQVPPTLSELSPKRVLGSVNLYVVGRHSHFTEAVQTSLVEHVVALAPDAVFITGDLTAQSLSSEFAKAREALQPILDAFPTLIIPGNHDVYTQGAQRSQRIRELFGEWMGLSEGPVGRLDIGNVTLLGLDPNRPHLIHASGVVPNDQLAGLAAILADPSMQGRRILLGIHHPPVDRHGELYTRTHHGLINAQDLVDTLDAAPVRPDAILSGHVHHGFRSEMVLSDAKIPVLDCGSSGYAWLPEQKRAAAMGLYDLSGQDLGVSRYLHDGTGFAPEPGGAFATGR
ncbi:MAG: metallophosphoesterase [Proteobacteria bacterium]|nr:metallophosphoesterase [Pseudomonadota bacterium]